MRIVTLLLLILLILTISNIISAENYTSYLISSTNNHLELGESINDIISILTNEDVTNLETGFIRTSKGSTDSNQVLIFSGSELTAVYESDSEVDPNVVGAYIKADSGDELFIYEIQFPDGLKSDIVSGNLEDLGNEDLFILGKIYSIVNETIDTSGNVNLTLLTGSATDTLKEGETKTYGIDGENFEISILNITDTNNTTSAKVKLMVNGEVTNSLTDEQTITLADGTVIGIRDILANEVSETNGPDIVAFFIKAYLIELNGNTNVLKIDQKTIRDINVSIISTINSGIASISKIRFTTVASDTTYMEKGKKLSTYLDESTAMISDMWDIMFDGLTEPGTTNISVKPSGNDKYYLDFTSQDGFNYHLLLLDRSSIGNVYVGKENGDSLIYKENISINENDVFIVGKGNAEFNANTHVLTLSDINGADNEITIKEMSTGDSTTYKLKYSSTNSSISSTDTRKVSATTTALTVGGDNYNVWVDAAAGGGAPDWILVDLDGDGSIGAGEWATIVAKGGLMLNAMTLDVGTGADAEVVGSLNFTIDPDLEQDVDTAASNPVNVTITTADTKELDASIYFGTGTTSSDEDSDDEKGMNQYGILVERKDSEDGADTIIITIPNEQVYFNVSIISYTINPHLFGPPCTVTSLTEICDNIDDNCNGLIDENIPNLTFGSNIGTCKQEIKSCINGTFKTIQNKTDPSTESCDNLDNDCDSKVDENLTRPSGTNFGVCGGNTEYCLSGIWVLNISNNLSKPETCNGLDDDCDGLVDEFLTNSSLNRIGLCSNNTIYCKNGSWLDNPNNYFQKTEICDDLDNDCDGLIDENANCISIITPTNNLISNSDKIGINITIAYPYNRLRYSDSSQTPITEKDLCKDCDEYGFLKKKSLSLKQGQHNLTFKFISPEKNTTRLVPIFIDSVAPVISSVTPKNSGYTNGSFIISYKEINLQEIQLNIGGINTSKTDCSYNPSASTQVCWIELNITSYNNKSINYTIRLRDIANNTKEAKYIKVNVDTNPPIFNVFRSNLTKNVLKFNLSLSEKVDLDYMDNLDKTPAWKTLCSNCDKYTSSKSFTTKGTHNLTVKATDKAGNIALGYANFIIN